MKKTLLLLMIAAVCLACGQKSDAASKPAATNANPAQPAQKLNLPPDHPPMGQAPGAMTASTPTRNAAQLLTGKVLETMNAGGYTYIKLKTDAGEPWVAVQQTQVKVGSTVTVQAQMTLDNFKSQTLNRTFDHIVFATMGGDGAAAAQAADPHGAPAAIQKNIGEVNVPKAQGAGAKTVAEVWAAKGTLKDAPVTIRGKVVKFLPEIMGKNWLHLRDGSGSAGKGDNDITVVTKDVVAVGDVVIVKGTVRVEKDFGAGYKYPVIVEDAKVTK